MYTLKINLARQNTQGVVHSADGESDREVVEVEKRGVLHFVSQYCTQIF